MKHKMRRRTALCTAAQPRVLNEDCEDDAASTATPTEAPVTAAASFDFSSQYEWDHFYQQQQEEQNENQHRTNEAAAVAAPVVDRITEWHTSVPVSSIAALVQPSDMTCLLPGCGLSALPQAILNHNHKTTQQLQRLVLLDSSPICIKQLQTLYGHSSTVEYLCGDATKLSQLLRTTEEDDDTERSTQFDLIIDKGFMDAILCGEGWDGILTTWFHEVALVLRESGAARYILISYPLPKSTQAFLREIGDEMGLDWEFDIELVNNSSSSSSSSSSTTRRRASVSVGTKIK